ncbi:MAG: TIGR04552 family protein [Gammaproteobacteria bacterium]|nr:TIGR04552 family protein [Gammaproteobacteria bacterium]
MNNDRRTWAGSALKAIIEDLSIIDSKGLDVDSLDEAGAFLLSYGFDDTIPTERDELESIRTESIAFLEEVLLKDGERILPSVRNQSNVRQLLVWASKNDGLERTKWSCALLRVMHTFAHCGSYLTEYYDSQIRNQILDQILAHIRQVEDKKFMGDIEIVHFESRPVKSRRSVVLKMLHKVENVSTEIFDWFGIRIVTRDRLDAIRVLDYLIRHNVGMLANIKASRSRNTLLDVDQLKKHWSGTGDLEKLRSKIATLNYPKSTGNRYNNSYSGPNYHSIQFTCRHRVRIDDPGGRQLRFFFPYEVQILDAENFKRTRSGRTSHAHYKKRQLAAARRRVLDFNRGTTR